MSFTILAKNILDVWRVLKPLYFLWTSSLHEKCLHSEFFMVPIFSHSDWIWRDAECLFIFSPNAGKYRPEKLRIRTLFTQCQTLIYNLKLKTNFNRSYSLVVLVWIHLFIFLRKYGIKFRQILKEDWNEKWKRASKIITNKKNRTAK